MLGPRQPTVLTRATAALADLRTSLQLLPAGEGCHVFLYAQLGRAKADRWRRLSFTTGLASEFRRSLANHLLTVLPPHRDLTAFSFDEMTDRQIGVIEKSEFKEINDWLDEIPSPDWRHLFDGSAPFFSKIKFHATTIAADGHTKLPKIFKKKTNNSLLHTGGIMAIFNRSRHQFSEVDGAIFDFSLDVDFFEWDDFVFIMHLQSFESLTNIRQITLTVAQDAISAVGFVDHLEVVGLPEIARQLNHKPALAKKLAAAKRQGTIDALKADTLVNRIRQKGLPLAIETKGEDHRVIVDTTVADQITEFINLITDVYLQSPVTSKEYKVRVKEPA